MARKLTGFVTITEFARRIGVSQSAVSQAIQNGRLIVYDGHGERVTPDYVGRKWLKPVEAARDWDSSRIRFDDDYLLRMIVVKIEEPFFTLKIRAGLTREQWADVAHALCRIAIDPPQSPEHRRTVAVKQALGPFGPYRCHAAISRRELARREEIFGAIRRTE